MKSKGGFGEKASKWGDAPENMVIRDENGEISEEFRQKIQNQTNSMKMYQKELGQKLNETIDSRSMTLPKIDQTEIESRNRFHGSADPLEGNFPIIPQEATGSAAAIADKSRYHRKIFIPKNSDFNYTGYLIGPKGIFQKHLEEKTNCKILVRGKGSQKDGQLFQKDDDEDLHVLITADDQATLAGGVEEIEKILFATEEQRNQIKRNQLNLMAKIRNPDIQGGLSEDPNGVDLSSTTPYGPPSADAKVITVPRDCIGLVIGILSLFR